MQTLSVKSTPAPTTIPTIRPAELPGRRMRRDGTALRFVTIEVNQGGRRSRRETNFRAAFERVAGFARRGDHARSNEPVELDTALPFRGQRNKLRHNAAMCGHDDTLPRFDSPNVPAKVVLQFAYASLHLLIMATCSHKAERRGVLGRADWPRGLHRASSRRQFALLV